MCAPVRRLDGLDRGRLVLGVHYPSDVEAGAIAAAVIATELRRLEEFKREFAAAKVELARWKPATPAAAATP